VELDKEVAEQNEHGYWVHCFCQSTLFFASSILKASGKDFLKTIKENKDRKKRLEEDRKKSNESLKKRYNLRGKK
jgi:hypothetical protein